MELKQLISQESGEIDKAMRADLNELSVLDLLLAEILDYGLFSGGKRVRPLLVVLCSRLCGKNDVAAYRLAIAFEYLHAATLFHDDVIDHADTRRGRMSVVKRYGMIGAILAGDYLHAQAMALVGRYGGAAGLEVFTEATRGMVEGEFLQLRHAGRTELSEDEYFSVVRGKTALLIGAACIIGGMFGGADPERQEALRTYGINLGSAFQIIDDLLDYQGDQRRTGKAVGNDLAEGKITLPLIIALRRSGGEERRRLLKILQDNRLRREKYTEVSRFIDQYQGFFAARQHAEKLIEEAVAALALFRTSAADPSLLALDALACYVLGRQS